ncbi:outer membrane usher protein [Natronospira proteinivora]|uniref:Outer membrane usher protein n=1 Tax=Natronospira proteinivora TaxID=1807133 RepID=A0ABT1GAA4_9GAMM|nr:fimbria/pilus outer membrane usher protein [Natronospira proteinivora]MCP1727233.1 outer membrane usher protein [Natronospira proteinivora]
MSRWTWNDATVRAAGILLFGFSLTAFFGQAVADEVSPSVGSVPVEPVCESDVEELWLRGSLDGIDQGFYLLVLEHISGRFLIREMDLVELGLSAPGTTVFRYRGEVFVPASWVDSGTFNFLPDAGRATIQTRPEDEGYTRDPFPGQCLPDVPEEFEDLLLTVEVNEQAHDRVVRAVLGPDGIVYLASHVVESLRLRVEGLPGRTRDGSIYHPLDAIEGLSYDLDQRQMALSIEAPASAFSRTHLRPRERPQREAQSSPGAFFNYELFAERRYQNGEQQTESVGEGGFYELGIFGGRGVFTTSGLARSRGDEREWIRLESALQIDNPDRMTTTILGDSLGDPGSWGNPVRFGGVSWGTDFSTRPEFTTFPLPSITAESPAPATVDVYVNEMLRHREEIPAGPFVVDDIPVVRGSGEVRLVTRDVLGREHVITQSLYASRQLLRQGLHEYQYSMGQVREDYGTESLEYGAPFGFANHRYGFTDWATGELRVEAADDWHTIGLGANIALPGGGVLDLAMAGSRDALDREGLLGQIGLQRIGRHVSFGARVRETRDYFTQLGEANIDAEQWRVSNAFIGFNLGRAGSINFSYVERQRDGEAQRLASGRYSLRFGRHASFQFSAMHPLEEDAESTLRASLTVPFGARSGFSHSTQQRGERERHRTMIRRNAPIDGGLGVRALSYRGDLEGEELHTHLRTGVGSYRLDASRYGDTETYRGQARGGIAFLGGRPFLSDWIFGSFAAVEVPEGEGIPVYRDNLPVAHTGSSGWALVPGLRAYENNRIRLDESELPMSLRIEDSVRSNVVPRRRSGVVVPFALSSDRTALVALQLPDGEPVPAGARVRVSGHDKQHPVAREGMVYITHLPESARLEAQWANERCAVQLEYPETDDPIPEVGPLVCRLSQ